MMYPHMSIGELDEKRRDLGELLDTEYDVSRRREIRRELISLGDALVERRGWVYSQAQVAERTLAARAAHRNEIRANYYGTP